MEKLSINQYINKKTGDSISATEWNAVFSQIQDKINEIIDNSGTTDKKTKLYINGELHTENKIVLESAKQYVIKGVLYGELVINAELLTAPTDNTYITFDGVTIVSNTDCAIVYKTPEQNKGYKDLVITLTKDSQNFIVANKSADRTDNQPGAIYSMNNMTVQGEGYLALHNKGGHGLRATELKVAGPHIYADVIHDAVHAGKYLEIDNCIIYCENTHDVFGTGTSGKLYALDADIHVVNIDGVMLNCGTNGFYTNTVKANNELTVRNVTLLSAIDESNFEQIFGVAPTPTVTVFATEEDYNANNGQAVDVSADTIAITSPYVKVSGFLQKPISYNPAVAVDLNVYLNGAYIKTTGNVPSINYIPANGKVKVTAAKDTINAIYNTFAEETTPELTESDGIKSENNIRIEAKNGSILYVTSAIGDGIDGGEVKITDTKGSVVVTNCGLRGIKGNAIVVGPNANIVKSVITPIVDVTDEEGYYVNPEDLENYSDMLGIAVCKHNCKKGESVVSAGNAKNTGIADIYCRNGKATKGVFGTTNTELKGVLICGSIAAVIGINFNNAQHIYYNRALTDNITKDCGITEAEYIAVPYEKTPITA